MAINSTRIPAPYTPTLVFQSNGQQVVTALYFCNVGNTAVSVNMYIVANGNVLIGPENQIYNGIDIQGGDTYVLSTERLMLEDQNRIIVDADVGNAITTTVSTYKV